jgi:hypothetical protein
MSEQESTRYSRAYRRGYDDGYDRRAIIDSVIHSMPSPIPNFSKEEQQEEDSYNEGFEAGRSDETFGKPHAFRPAPEPVRERPKQYARPVADDDEDDDDSSSSSSNDPEWIIKLIVFVAIAAAVIWLAVRIAIPLIILLLPIALFVFFIIKAKHRLWWGLGTLPAAAFMVADLRMKWVLFHGMEYWFGMFEVVRVVIQLGMACAIYALVHIVVAKARKQPTIVVWDRWLSIGTIVGALVIVVLLEGFISQPFYKPVQEMLPSTAPQQFVPSHPPR